MQNHFTGQIEGEFVGYHEDAIFKLTNGEVWQQSRYKYLYHYAYRPQVRIYEDGSGRHLMKVQGVNEPIEVKEVSLVTEGTIVSKFEGFGPGRKFEFQNGQVWIQREGKQRSCFKNRPLAIVVDGLNGFQLHVDGMEDPVRVRRT